MGYIISLESKKELTLIEKKAYISSLWGAKEKLGTMEKFSKAISKKRDFLFPKITAVPFGAEIAKFQFKESEKDLAFKWKDFLKKVYPELVIDISLGKLSNTTLDYVLSNIFTDVQDYPVTVEMSVPKKLNKKELQSVKKLLEEIKNPNLYYICRQYKCDTCAEVNKDNPVHFEIDYHYNKKYKKKKGLEEKCFECYAELKDDFCEACEIPYEFKV